MVWGVLTPPENGAGEFSVRKKCQHFQEKLGSQVVQVGKFHAHIFSATPNKKIQNQREPPYKLESDGSVLSLEDDSDDEPEDAREYLDMYPCRARRASARAPVGKR